MPNSWFRFKQFQVQQDRCAMKVSTDACIQGAWTARQFTGLPPGARILDIGTGTGLLSLMLAQQLPGAGIDAIDMNEAAWEQACENFTQSPWAGRLRAQHLSLQAFTAGNPPGYHGIVCNPPFFHNHLPATQQSRNDARHSSALSKESLAQGIQQLLLPGGRCSILYPASEWESWCAAAAGHGLYPQATLHIRPSASHEVNRIVGTWVRQPSCEPLREELAIYDQRRQYTPDFRSLLQPYYLAL